MKPQAETIILSNFMLFIDHMIQQQGVAFKNHSSLFYSVPSDVAGLYAYSSPFKPLANDTSISGAQIISGLYVGGTYTPVGSGGLTSINHYKGVSYFDHPLGNQTVSGNYAIKEFGIELSDQPEWRLMFETKYTTSSYCPQLLSGLIVQAKTAPIIWVTLQGQENEPFGFRHLDNNKLKIRCVVISDNEFQSLNVCSILKGLNKVWIPILSGTSFDSMGNMTGINFNYNNTPKINTMAPLIDSARSIDISPKGDYENMRKNLALVDFEIQTILQAPNSQYYMQTPLG
jgi:hypothetical protein